MMRKLILILFVFIMSGCLPQDSARNTTNQSSDDSSDNSTTTFNGDLNFVVSGQDSQTATLAADFKDVLYLRGGAVSNFFETQENVLSQRYCLVMNFEDIVITPSTGTIGSRQLRVLVTPSSYFDFNDQAMRQVFKIDFASSAANTANCQGMFSGYSSSTPSQVFYGLDTLCPNCNTAIAADNIFLVKTEATILANDTNLIKNSLNISVGYSGASSGGGGSTPPAACSASSCNQTGFCCDTESASCVQHSSPKPGIAANAYAAALAAITLDPSSITQYPEVFYICPGQVPIGSGGGSGSDVVQRIQTDYLCAEELRANALGSPYQQFLNTTPNTCDVNTPGSCRCNYADANEDLFYISVLERLYNYCNCQGANATEKFTNCASFYYEVLASNAANEPVQFKCSPVEVVGFDPNVSISSRSVPHRFYSTAGQSIDDLTKASAGTTQEGDEFQYLGTDTYIFPVNGSFNMNSLLGSMKVDLSSAQPAQIVSIEQGQTYIIRNTESSFYIPCVNCASDSWFPPFKALPTNTLRDGFGLQAFSHTTRRDANEFNTGLGNYEDTIWGRACFVPPTMLPFSQPFSQVATAQQSRQARLKAQAALYMNGYQRDWFGFNLGALIGSFDGVSWFAIGRNRLVEAKSDKLFLAINAPFGDLATPNSYNLVVEPYIPGPPQASEYDFDPNQSLSSGNPLQNLGGSCQRYHICNTDTDCATQLGWEYVCADADARSTYWPTFTNAEEQAVLPARRGIIAILQQDGLPPTDTNKRCVYRGAGSLCVQNPELVTDEQLRRSLTCAPNFYCANPAQPVFNNEVARYAATLSEIAFLPNNHVFGQDANIIGRPLHYITGSTLQSIPADVRQTLQENLMANNTLTSQKILAGATVGLCRPGRVHAPAGTTINTSSHNATIASLQSFNAADPVRSHSFKNINNETDYISQIGTTNINERSFSRYLSCPVISEEGDYLHLEEDMVRKYAGTNANEIMATFINQSVLQNATGQETQNPAGQSPFASIEAGTLDGINLILSPTLVQNACLRRAGAVCHTDLDCAPGRLHEGLVNLFDDSYYGNLAEKQYWSETLVCGQADTKPAPNLSTFETYDIRKNRCCREVGKDLTIFSSNAPETDFALDTKKPGYLAPTALDRYSRLGPNEAALDADMTNVGGIIQLLSNPNQWESVHNAASRTCCGGGWIRKFSNGTNDWKNPVQPQFNVTDFSCLNYITPFARQSSDDLLASFGILQTITNSQRNLLCEADASTSPACIQLGFQALDFATEQPPLTFDAGDFAGVTAGVDPNSQSIFVTTNNTNLSDLNVFAPYKPILLNNNPGLSTMFETATTGNIDIELKLPSYIPAGRLAPIAAPLPRVGINGINNANGVYNFRVSLVDILNPGAEVGCGFSNLDIIPNAPAPADSEDPDCTWEYTQSTGGLEVTLVDGQAAYAAVVSGNSQYAIAIHFLPPGMYPYQNAQPGLLPASPYFILKRLARMELAGVPQVFHEALYCHDNQGKLVPGLYNSSFYTPGQSTPDIFDNSIPGVSDASNIIYSLTVPPPITNLAGDRPAYITNYDNLSTDPAFSESEFKCCKKLNAFVTNQDQCCTGHGVTDQQNPGFFQCKLPTKTDVSLYFNRFISGEGSGEELEDTGIALTSDDFDPHTGEPLLTEAVFGKLQALAVNFCDSGDWRFGGAFGSFIGQPSGVPQLNNQIFSIVDSGADSDPDGATAKNGTTGAGFAAYTSGYRWNHHIYCKDPND